MCLSMLFEYLSGIRYQTARTLPYLCMCCNKFCFYFQKLLELEYSVDEDRRDLQSKVESLESLVRILEIKAKNSNDHGMTSFIAQLTIYVLCLKLLFKKYLVFFRKNLLY